MFKKTINFSDLKADPQLVSDLKDEDVLQIIHRGQEVKVLMTQEHYFYLLAQIEKLKETTKVTPYEPAKLLAKIDEKMRGLQDMLNKNEKAR